tara:strand:- start:50 stop:442 length:393 start_codon:yes stop_codon:yes gene_type:complete
MDSKPVENGLEELMRLSRQTAKWGKEAAEKEKQQAEHDQKVVGVVHGLRDISFSVALEQLEQVATPEIIEKIRLMTNKRGIEDLRKVISALTRDLETTTSRISVSNPEMAPVEHSVKTLAILIGLFFSLK